MSKNKETSGNHPVVLSFLAIIAAVEFIRMSLFLTFLPSFLTKLHFDTVALGAVISANILADNLSKGAMGWLVDHKGPWPVLFSGSLAVFAGILIIINFHQHLSMLIIAAIIIGLGVSPAWPAVISGAIQSLGEAKKATAISLISVIWLAGGGLGPIIMGFLIDAGKGGFLKEFNLAIIDAYQTGFALLITMAILAVTICLLGWFFWRRIPHLQEAVAIKEQNKHRLKDVLCRLWKVKGLIPGMLFQTISLGMLLPNLLPYATGKLGLTESEYSMLLLIGGLAVILLMVPVGRWADHWGTRGFLVTGFAMASFSLMLLGLWGNSFNIWGIVILIGMSYALIQPSWNALLAGVIPPAQRGVLMGLFMSVEGLGFGIGPIIGGLLGKIDGSETQFLQSIGPAAPFYVSSICLAMMAVVYLVYPFHQYNDL
ncbi:MAG: MFS transporter [Bacteroidota bacterium]